MQVRRPARLVPLGGSYFQLTVSRIKLILQAFRYHPTTWELSRDFVPNSDALTQRVTERIRAEYKD